MNKYVAYAGTYTHEQSDGIHIYDIDPETFTAQKHSSLPVKNVTDLVLSNNRKFLYGITDDGVSAFAVLPDGSLQEINHEGTGAMRGFDLEIDENDELLFVGGYYDGSVSMLELNPDGSVGEVRDIVFHKRIAEGISEFDCSPHVTCVKILPDKSGIAAVDAGLNQVKLYQVDKQKGKLVLKDILRPQLDSMPGSIRFSADGKFAYLLCQKSMQVIVYALSFDEEGRYVFEEIQKADTVSSEEERKFSLAMSMELSPDGRHLFVTNAGENTLCVFTVHPENGRLEFMCCTKTGGSYPKNLLVMPDNTHVSVIMNESDMIVKMHMNYEKKYFLQDAKPISIKEPNCMCLCRLS